MPRQTKVTTERIDLWPIGWGIMVSAFFFAVAVSYWSDVQIAKIEHRTIKCDASQ